MRRAMSLVGSIAVFLLLAGPAAAHVTIQPTEAPTGEFFRFVVRVPTEREDAATTKIEVQFPETLFFASFQPMEGWERSVEMVTLDEPVEVFGEPQDTVVGTVTWEATGAGVGPGEFQEFGFSALVPDEPGQLLFPSIQTYDSGEVVRWIGPPESDEPAPIVEVIDLGGGEGQGELAVLAELRREGGQGSGEEEESSSGGLSLALGWAAVALSVTALAVSLRRRRS
jgi:uncharacterized protein YcnI